MFKLSHVYQNGRKKGDIYLGSIKGTATKMIITKIVPDKVYGALVTIFFKPLVHKQKEKQCKPKTTI